MLLGRNMICVLGVMSYSNKSISIRASPAMAEKDAGIFQFEKMVGHIGTIDCPDEKGIFGGCA